MAADRRAPALAGLDAAILVFSRLVGLEVDAFQISTVGCGRQGRIHQGSVFYLSGVLALSGDTKTYNHTGLLGCRRASQGQHLQ
jgi:hypothetical protein